MKKVGSSLKMAASAVTLLGLMTVPFSGQAWAAEAQGTDVPLPGTSTEAASHGQLVGPADSNQRISLTVSLQLQNAANIDSFITSLYDPSSSNYKHFLTPQEFAQKFGPSATVISQITSFAKSLGLQVDNVSPEGTLIHVSGTIGQIEKGLGVSINNYRDSGGALYYANANLPKVPGNLANIIVSISGLNNEPQWHHAAIESGVQVRNKGQYVSGKPGTASPNVGSGPAGGYTPTELRSAYNVSPLTSAGTNGSGQTVALFELDGYKSSNITTYDNYYSLGSPAPTTKLVDGYSGAAGSGEGEVELDIEVINAIAPKANVVVYEGPNSNQGVIDTYQKIATDDTAKEVSSSWGLSELQSSSSEMNAMHNIFLQMASQGQSIFAASGDSGAYDGGGTQLAVDSPANDPNVTGVGGTHLTLSSGTYGSESVWSNTSNSSGGGGGLSTYFNQPSWQSGPGVQNSYSNGKREVPDVSADADPATGYSIYSGGSWVVYGGTSCAAPLWAAITALNNQYAEANGKADLGFANPTLYKMFNTSQTYPAWHDVTTGNNLYYPATTGYDLASGIGTPNVYNLVRDINGSSSGGTGGGTGGGTSSQLITNGGFENGSSPWIESSAGGYELVDTSNPHTGSYSAYLGGYDNADDSIYETVSIPSGITSATLSFWSDVQTTETSHSYDYMYVKVRDANGNVLQTLQTQSDATPTGWQNPSFDLSQYAGKTVEIYFEATNDSSNPTNFFVDDVALNTK